MDHFERQLTRMMRAAEEHTPFEARHRERLWAGVRARRRARAAQRAVGSLLAVAGVGVGVFLLPGTRAGVEPAAPVPRPASSPLPSPSFQGTSPAPGFTPGGPSSPPPTGRTASTSPAGPPGAAETTEATGGTRKAGSGTAGTETTGTGGARGPAGSPPPATYAPPSRTMPPPSASSRTGPPG
ncbi:hypothetical protein [Streptomyces sp. NRRL S-340]|uniref:hypothetical protein n=1 Tax=Streptomyces sp. NRRL S-340 TaxID=1463901 RepID=UPI0007C4D3E9|nr:hypothetical protein [Streptomyces sp. NRRL S-340]